MIRSVFALAALFSLSGCGYLFGDDGLFRDSSEDYKTAPERAVIQVPEGKSDEALRELYAVPDVEDSLLLSGEFEVPRPAPLVAGSSDQLVRIQKLGDERWALIGVPPGQVWPQVRSFIAALGLQVNRADAREGIMETAWVSLDSEPVASRFQFRIEQGVQRGNSELHVLQQNQAGDINRWPGRSDDLEQEAEMLQSVSQYIANSSDTAPVSMIADQSIQAAGRISLQEADDGHTYIQVGLPYARAWASLDRALQASTFQITDRNRSAGEYFVTFLGPDAEEEDGWFDWLFDEEEHPLAGRNFLVTATPEGSGDTAIRLAPRDGAPLEQREEQALLALLKGNIY